LRVRGEPEGALKSQAYREPSVARMTPPEWQPAQGNLAFLLQQVEIGASVQPWQYRG
jgi:hypothetical protein